MKNEAAVVIKEISKSYGAVKALSVTTLSIPHKSTCAICGPSGSGKTTLLRLISGLDTPDTGEIYLYDKLVSTPDYVLRPHRRGIGYVFQTPALWPHMTIRENLLFGLNNLSKGAAKQRVQELLSQMDLEGLENRYPNQISGGQAKRVALARTLGPKPNIILMDEPLTNIDKELKRKMLGYIKSHVLCEASVLIYVTHDPDEATELAEKIVVIRGGHIEE